VAIARDGGTGLPATATLSGSGGSSLASPTFSTVTAATVLLATVSVTASGAQNESSVTLAWTGSTPAGASTWSKVGQAISADNTSVVAVFLASCTQTLSSVGVTSSGWVDTYPDVHLAVDAYTGASATLGATQFTTGTSGAAAASITTTGSGSWVIGGGVVSTTSTAPTYISSPAHTQIYGAASTNNSDYGWSARLTSAVNAGAYSFGTTAPTSTKWNVAVVELQQAAAAGGGAFQPGAFQGSAFQIAAGQSGALSASLSETLSPTDSVDATKAGSEKHFGYDSTSGFTYDGHNWPLVDQLQMERVYLSETGLVSKLVTYFYADGAGPYSFSSSSFHVRPGIYRDDGYTSGGYVPGNVGVVPGSRVADGPEVSGPISVPGWCELALDAPVQLSAGYYWIGVNANSSGDGITQTASNRYRAYSYSTGNDFPSYFDMGDSGTDGGVIRPIYGVYSLPTTISESAAPGDALAATQRIFGNLTETASLLEATSRAGISAASVSDSATVSDSTGAASRLPSSLAETAAVVEALARSGSASTTISESASAIDSLAGAGRLPAALQEIGSASEAYFGVGMLAASLAEYASVSDAVDSLIQSIGPTLSESAAVADAFAAALRVAATISDSVAPGDSAVASVRLGVALSESASVSDALAPAARLVASITESGNPTDAMAAVAAFGAALSEAASASDAQAARAAFAASLSEATAPDFVLTRAAILPASLSESASVDDYAATVNGPVVWSGSVSEGASPADSIVSALFQRASLSESATPSDAVNPSVLIVATLSEAASPSDSLAAAASRAASLSENVSTADALEARERIATGISESATVGDSLSVSTSGPSVKTGTILEEASVGDTMVAAVVFRVELSEGVSPSDLLSIVAPTHDEAGQVLVLECASAALLLDNASTDLNLEIASATLDLET
jgi:hypothetical protein